MTLRTPRVVFTTLVLGALALAGCASGPSPASTPGGIEEMEPIVLRFSDPYGETANNVRGMQAWMDHVEEATEGKVTFEKYIQATLHPDTEGLSAIQGGLTDITFFLPGSFGDQVPASLWGAKYLPSLASTDMPHALLSTGPAMTELYTNSEDLVAELAQYNAMPFVFLSTIPLSLLCTEPVDSVESAAGKVVVTYGEPWVSEAPAVGLTNASIAPSETYEAIERGVIDCVLNQPSMFINASVWDVAKYYTPSNFSPSLGAGYVFNMDTWNSLPSQVQEIMMEARGLAISASAQTIYDRVTQFAAEGPSKGIEVLDATALNGALRAYQEEAAQGAAAAAPAVTSDPQGVLDAFAEYTDSWVAKVDDLGIKETKAGEMPPQIPWSEYEEMLKSVLGD